MSNGYNEEEMKLVKETRKIWVSIQTSLKFPLVDGRTYVFGLTQNDSSFLFLFFIE